MIFEQLYVFFLILQAPTPLASHRGGTSVSAKSMGSNDLLDDSESFLNQGREGCGGPSCSCKDDGLIRLVILHALRFF